MSRDITERRGRDSNPRAFWAKAFQEPRIRPLCHPSRRIDSTAWLGAQGIRRKLRQGPEAGRTCDLIESIQASASRQAASALALMAGPWAPAAG